MIINTNSDAPNISSHVYMSNLCTYELYLILHKFVLDFAIGYYKILSFTYTSMLCFNSLVIIWYLFLFMVLLMCLQGAVR